METGEGMVIGQVKLKKRERKGKKGISKFLSYQNSERKQLLSSTSAKEGHLKVFIFSMRDHGEQGQVG